MLHEALEFLGDLFNKSKGVEVIEFGDPTKRIIAQNGDREVISLPAPPPRREALSFLDFATAFHETAGEVPAEQLTAAVWFTQDLVRFYTDEPHRQAHITLPLQKSYLWAKVMGFRQPQILDQGGLVELLRNELLPVMASPSIVEVFSTINWTANEQQRVALANANRSLDADIAQRAVGSNSAELPDEIFVEVAPYVNQQLFNKSLPLRLRIETKPLEKRFRLWMDPSSLEAAERTMAEWVRSEIASHLPEAIAIYGTGDLRR